MVGQEKEFYMFNLRRRAERLLDERADQMDTTWIREINDVFHELQLRDLEVEIQNEELRSAQEQLQISHDRYADLYHFSPVGYFTLDDDGVILDLNETGAMLLYTQRDQVIGKLFAANIVREDQEEFYFYHKSLLESKALKSKEIRLVRADKSRFYGQLQGIVVQENDDSDLKCRIALSDITEQRRRQMIDNLLRSGQHLTGLVDMETLLRQLVETVIDALPSAELAILWMYNKQQDALVMRAWAGNYNEDMPQLSMPVNKGLVGQIYCTGEVQNIDDVSQEPVFVQFGYPYIEMIRSVVGVPIHTADGVIGVLMAYNYSRTNNFSNDTLNMLEALATQISLAIHNAQLFEEITHAHDQLRYLTQQVVTTQEQERYRISRELHDEAGQALIMLKLALRTLQNQLPDESAALQHQVDESIVLVDETTERIRNLAYTLRPPALDTMTLSEVLRTHCEDFSARTSLGIIYESQPINPISDDIKITLYRFLQEALTNVARHADAHNIEVQLSLNDDVITLVVQDDGEGFDIVEVEAIEPRGLGLLGIRERLAAVHGQLEIFSKIGDGVRLVAHVPWVNQT